MKSEQKPDSEITPLPQKGFIRRGTPEIDLGRGKIIIANVGDGGPAPAEDRPPQPSQPPPSAQRGASGKSGANKPTGGGEGNEKSGQ